MKFTLKLALISFVFLFFLNLQAQKSVQTINALTFSKKLQETPNAQLIDVRTPEEFASEHLEKAENINWNDSKFTKLIQAKNKKQPIFVYCKAGGRSGEAANKLVSLGFETVYNLDGGILKWNEAGLGKKEEKPMGMSDQDLGILLKNNPKILIVYYAKWCSTCKKMAPILLDLKSKYEGKVEIIKIDADENKTLLANEKVSSLPTMRFYKNENLQWKHSGEISKKELENIISK